MLSIILATILTSHGINATPAPTPKCESLVRLDDGRTARFLNAHGDYVIMTNDRKAW